MDWRGIGSHGWRFSNRGLFTWGQARSIAVAPVYDRRFSPLIERLYNKWPSSTYVLTYSCYGGATKIERFFIPGPAGALEALLEHEPGASPRFAALACHPHPLYGGTMHNKVVFRASQAAVREGIPALRFNYRGVGKSDGKFGEGAGEEADVRAALGNLRSRFSLPVVLIGFSFGSAVGLRVGAEDPGVLALIGLGLAPARHDYSFLRQSRKPKLFIQGTQDQFGPRDEVESLIATLPPPKTMRWIQGGDHFFTGKLGEVEEVIRTFLQEVGTWGSGLGNNGGLAAHLP